MKKRFGVAALALAAGCAVVFAGCSGCGNNGKTNEALFSSNWYADTNYRYIQPSFSGEENAEVVTYTVTHDTKSAGNKSYSVKYEGGTYTTKFYATTFDKDLVADEFKTSYPQKEITVYRYETELTFLSVTFTKGDKTEKFDNNTVTTVSYFLDVNSHLQPLYSEQTVNMVSPAEYQITILEEAYLKIDRQVKTYYKYDGSAAKTVITGDTESAFVTDLSGTDNSVIDVNGLNVAVRAMQLGTSLSQVISVYSPSGKMQDYTFAGSSAALGVDERKAYEEILARDNLKLFVPGEGKSLNTVCVTATLNADMKGVSQQYWFAAIDNAKNNTGRATMVKMSVPLTFDLGTLNYSLDNITSTLYND